MDKRDKGYTLYKKGLSCTEISKKLDVSINTVKSWRKRYWTQGADAPAKRTLHPEDAPAHLTLKQTKTGRAAGKCQCRWSRCAQGQPQRRQAWWVV